MLDHPVIARIVPTSKRRFIGDHDSRVIRINSLTGPTIPPGTKPLEPGRLVTFNTRTPICLLRIARPTGGNDYYLAAIATYKPTLDINTLNEHLPLHDNVTADWFAADKGVALHTIWNIKKVTLYLLTCTLNQSIMAAIYRIYGDPTTKAKWLASSLKPRSVSACIRQTPDTLQLWMKL